MCNKVKVKVKFTILQATKAQSWIRSIDLLFFNLGTRFGWVVNAKPRPFHPPGKTRYSLYRRLGGPQDRFGWVEKSRPTGTRSRTVQPVASRSTYCAIPAQYVIGLMVFWQFAIFCEKHSLRLDSPGGNNKHQAVVNRYLQLK